MFTLPGLLSDYPPSQMVRMLAVIIVCASALVGWSGSGSECGPFLLAQESAPPGGTNPQPPTTTGAPAPANAVPTAPVIAAPATPPASSPIVAKLSELTQAVFNAPRYAVVMGINDYADDGINDLALCEQDAQAVYDLLIDPAIGGVPKENATLLLGNQATAQGIRLALAPLSKIPQHSVVFVYYSGHGMKEGDEAFWVTQDANRNQFPATALSNTEIQLILGRIVSKRVIVMIDACYAAATTKSKAVEFSESLKKFTGQGRAILSAAGNGEEAIEADDLKHSVYTYYLLAGLRGAADENTDGVLVLPEITNYLDLHVSEEASKRNGYQHPIIDLDGVQEPAKFSVVIDAARLQVLATASVEAQERRAARMKALRALALDEVLTVEQYTEAKRLLAIEPAKLSELESVLLAEYGRVLDGELPADKLAKALELARAGSLPTLLSAPFTPTQAAAAQTAWAKSLGQKVIETNTVGMQLVLIPPGEFDMGSPETEESRDDDERQHRVRLTKPFRLSATEVTQGQWFAVMKTRPWEGNLRVTENDDHPAVDISHDDAVEFCERLSQQENRIYSLPTEAQWEYACRAGTTTPFHFGDSNNGKESNIDGNYPYGTTTKGPYLERTATVKSYRPNAFGLYDLHGNVWEWCDDWSDDYASGAPVTTDPSGPAQGSLRVLRGGCWYYVASNCRSALRSVISPDNRSYALGFRVALVPASK